jgi:hypothetical protein
MSEADDSPISSPLGSRRSSVSLLSSTSTLPIDSPDDGSMPLPPKGHFESFEALERYAQNHAQDHGYAVSFIRWK